MKGMFVGLMATAWAAGAMADGNTLVRNCESAIQMAGGKAGGDLIGAGRCQGLVEGTLDTVYMMDTVHNAKRAICLPEGVTKLQLIKITVKYINDNPKLLNQNESSLIMLAALDAFPCNQ
ncbi:Rap1a/Tai family immunity protein [Pseudomonas sp. OTU5201]|uniref:Rap1a/Tai family immunity protein n=1 Tax=Pseudomonas sp. OTU5201 TaxID=3043850 RepID=UPI00313C2BBD